MKRTLAVDTPSGKYPRTPSVKVWQQATSGAASAGAAHQRAMRLEAEWRRHLFTLRLAENHSGLARCLAMTQAECDTAPVLPIRKALRLIGGSNRRQEEKRDDCTFGEMTRAELTALLRATEQDIGNDLQAVLAIKAELDLRPDV